MEFEVIQHVDQMETLW